MRSELDRDRSYLLNEAIENYIEIYQWQIAEINLAIAEADAEDFASDEISQLNFNFI